MAISIGDRVFIRRDLKDCLKCVDQIYVPLDDLKSLMEIAGTVRQALSVKPSGVVHVNLDREGLRRAVMHPDWVTKVVRGRELYREQFRSSIIV